MAFVIHIMVVARIKTRTEFNEKKLPSIDDVPAEHWTKLAQKKIFFGHQSVGYNIIDGIMDILNERNYIELNIIETQEPSVFDQPVFAHSRIGMNTKPFSKINGFVDVMESSVGSKVDMAFFKFCYVDFTRNTDFQEIFGKYTTAVEKLSDKYPDVKFLHVTMPIRSVPKQPKRYLKQTVKMLIGKPGYLEDNMIRMCYNDLLTNAFSQTGFCFDLAFIESVNADGFRCYGTKGAEKVTLMAPEYTEDGGHLNSMGRRKVAEQLLISLADMAGRP